MIQTHSRAPVCASDPDLWFSTEKADRETAKHYCQKCPLLIECREYGKTQEHGVWGGVVAKPLPNTDRPSTTQLDREHRDQRINALDRNGWSISEIAIHLSISPRTVTRVRTASTAA